MSLSISYNFEITDVSFDSETDEKIYRLKCYFDYNGIKKECFTEMRTPKNENLTQIPQNDVLRLFSEAHIIKQSINGTITL